MADKFDGHQPGLDSPASSAAAVEPSATALANTARALYVGGAGNVNVTTVDGNTVAFNSVPAGTFLPVRVTHVLSTSTTATDIVALW